jgi:CubicO group peptidase (beta-lactamase class C family)
MSITKSFTSALVGVAIDKKIIPGADAPVNKVLPRVAFASNADFQRFGNVTVKDVLGMSALDADEPPHSTTPEDTQRGNDFIASKNHTAFALTQKILPNPGVSFQYNDITPQIASGMIEYATKKTLLQFAQDALFGPLGFHNQEWMGEDASGIDNGAYGLRIRPIDMQKFGILYLRGGDWNGTQLVPKSWVDLSFQPWNRSKPKLKQPDYGWYWWTENYGTGWAAHVANGWRGQRIAIIPEQQMVVTITGDIEDGTEDKVFDNLMRKYIAPAIGRPQGGTPDPKAAAALADALAQVHAESRIPPQAEKRMIPAIAPKEKQHNSFSPIAPLASTAK